MEKDMVDFVNPMFLWISPIENKVEGSRKRCSAVGLGQAYSNTTNHRPGSPIVLLKAKTALQRRFSGGSNSVLVNERGIVHDMTG